MKIQAVFLNIFFILSSFISNILDNSLNFLDLSALFFESMDKTSFHIKTSLIAQDKDLFVGYLTFMPANVLSMERNAFSPNKSYNKGSNCILLLLLPSSLARYNATYLVSIHFRDSFLSNDPAISLDCFFEFFI